jgi:hypothetical protein
VARTGTQKQSTASIGDAALVWALIFIPLALAGSAVGPHVMGSGRASETFLAA